MRHTSAAHAATVLNVAMEHSGRSLARVGWTALASAVVVLLAVCAIAIVALENPWLVVAAPIVGALLVWYGSPLVKAWLWSASFIRPPFSLS